MQIRPIENEADYRRALEEVEPYFENPPSKDDPGRDAVDAMISVIEAYERRHYSPLDNATAVDALRFVMEQQELTAKDLAPCVGSVERVEETLTGKRPLTLSMIRRLHEAFGIPLTVLFRT